MTLEIYLELVGNYLKMPELDNYSKRLATYYHSIRIPAFTAAEMIHEILVPPSTRIPK